MSHDDPPRLVANGLVVGHGRQRVAGPIDAVWEAATLTALTGPNGSGKTTLMRTLLGFLPPLEGSVAGRAGRLVGYVPQHGTLDSAFPLTAAEVVGTALHRGSRAERQDRIRSALHEVEMEARARQPFFRLSGGQQQRVLIARAIAADAEIVVLDEPTAGIDPDGSARIWERMRGLATSGKLVLVVTHDVFRAPEHCDLVLTLDGGGLREFTR